jgi:hypothetical protein
MLDISFRELTGSAAEQVLAHEVRPGVDERHHVLQLIAETEGPARLVGSAPRPETARYGLVQEPSVDQHIERGVRCFHLHGAQCVIPVLPHLIESPARRSRSPEAIRQVAGVIVAPSYAEREDDLTLFPVRYLEGHMDRGAGIQSGPHLARKPRPPHGGRTPKRAVAPNEFLPVAGNGSSRIVHVEKSHPVGKFRIVGVPREECSAVGV